MLSVHQVSNTYGIQPVLKEITFSIGARERVGLIGPNGCGKTTLMRILAGLEKPDSGTVLWTVSGLRVGYLAQGLELAPGETIRSSLGLGEVPVEQLELEIAAISARLVQSPQDATLQEQYDRTLARLAEADTKPAALLGPLGLAGFALETPISHLSGGQKTRLMLARVLMNEPGLLLLDEPTNHLDIGMLEWLETWLRNFKGAALVISHDRAFLDHAVSQILELDPASHCMRAYPGNYSAYIEQKLNEQAHQLQAYSDQQAQIAQLQAAAAHIRGLTKMKKGGKADGGDKFAKGFFGNRATKNTAGRAKHIEDRIEKIFNEERVEKPRPSWQLKLDFGAPAHQSKDVLITENLAVGYAGYAPLLSNLNLNIRAGQRIALTGENGAGKTSLLRTITGSLPAAGGLIKLGQNVRVGYMSQEQESLRPQFSPLQTIQGISPFNETEARHFLHFFLFGGDDALRPCGEMSYGERARLQLAMLVAQGCSFLLLDEPINHLDIPARARFEQALAKYEGTILAVVHDRYFIDHFASDVWVLADGQIRKW
jgi:ATP-binding cassette subfamily F protein 3